MTQLDGSVACDASGDQNACRDSYGWTFQGADGWETYAEAATNRTFYVQGKAAIGDSGSVSDPLQITVIAEGSIDISSNADIIPDTDNVMFVTDGDLDFTGGTNMHAPGQILVHEQIKLAGNPDIIGQITVENAANLDSLVTDNTIAGDVTITYDGGLGGRTFSVRGWRDVRDSD